MRKPFSLKKKILLWLLGIIGTIVLAIIITIVFFLDGILNKTVRPELAEWVRRASHNQYELVIGRIGHTFTSLSCEHIDLVRVRYDSLTPGFFIRKCSIDTVLISGISWWDILWKNGLKLDRVEIRHPSLHISRYTAGEERPKEEKMDTGQFLPTVKKIFPSIAVDSILLSDISVQLSSDMGHQHAILRGTNLAIGNFGLDTLTMRTNKYLLFSKSIHIDASEAQYIFEDSLYSLRMKGLKGSFEDSSLSIDTFSFSPNYNERDFANKNKYNRGRLTFECTGLQAEGIQLSKLLRFNAIIFSSAKAKTWRVDYYSDKRKPSNPNPPAALMPNDIFRNMGIAIRADSLSLSNGYIHIREQSPVSNHISQLTFEKTNLVMTPLLIDSSLKKDADRVGLYLNTMFQGIAPLTAQIVYPLSRASFDMDIKAHVGGFDAKSVNSFLVYTDRTEITEGKVISGDISMQIRNGVATTAVTPRFQDLSVKFLSKKSSESRSIWDGIKTTLANIFVIKSNNLDKEGSPAKTATTTRKRLPPEEFFQFLWFAVRRSLGEVVGGFK